MINLTFTGHATEVLNEMKAFLGSALVEAAVAELPEKGSSPEKPATEVVAEADKPKKTRAKKTEPTGPELPPAEQSKPETPQPTAAEATAYVATEQDARDALRRLHEATNEDTCMSVLASHGNARRISEIPVDQLSAFVLACNEKIAAASPKAAA